VIALLLAAVGLYGVVAYSVSQRTREIGVRIALGAAADHVVGMIVRQGLRPVLAGTVLGLIISAYGARLISSMLFGVSPQDPITIVGVTALLVLVTLAATAIPARRAARVPPATALEAE
ncbi:MAG: FtsX-like permease family protein, partial [Gemmatimonadota bacterium]